MEIINGTLIWYYYICPREVWLMSRHLNPSQENPFIEIGRLISNESYKHERKEVRVENIALDILKNIDGEVVIGEVKKSSKYEKSAKMQLCYYLLRLKSLGITAKGILLFPKEKKKIQIELTQEIEEELEKTVANIKAIIEMPIPPSAKKIVFCSKCGYNGFCWS